MKTKGGKKCVSCGKPRASVPYTRGRFSGFIHAACLKLPCIPFAKLPEEKTDVEGWVVK